MKKTLPLTAFTLTMINIAAISSVKNWPLTAEYGLSAIGYILLAVFIFFIPLSLITAELATSIPKSGGVYVWIKMAFGHRLGFLGIWIFWLLNVIWFPTILSFLAANVAYAFNPDLLHSKVFTLSIIIGSFWIATLLSLRGMKTSGWISTIGAICGTFLPGLIIIGLGISWWINKEPVTASLTVAHLIPSLQSMDDIVFFVGILLSFTGIEMSAIHAKDVKNPQKSYLRSIIASAIILTLLTILGVLSIASVVPTNQLSLVSGTLQAFTDFLRVYHLSHWLPCIAALMALGAFGSVSSWLIGCAKGLLSASSNHDLPRYLRATNSHGIPHNLLIAQAILVSLIALLFALMPSLSATFWVLSALVAQLYLIVYVLLFLSALKLRYSHPSLPRPYRVPGGKIGLWILASLGLLGSIFGISIGFIPPPTFDFLNPALYALTMLGAILIACLMPSIIKFFKHPPRQE